MDRLTGNQAKSLMEAYSEVYTQPEVEQLNEGPADDPRWGVLGQLERARRKMFGTADEVKDAASFEASMNALTKSRGPGNVPLGADGKPITAAQIAAETKRRRLADPNYKGQRSSTQTQTAVPSQLGAPDKAGSRKRYGNTTYEVQNGKWVPLTASQVTGGNAPVRPAGGNAPVRPAGGVVADKTSSAPAPAPSFKVGDQQMTKAQINAKYAELRKTDPAAAKAFGDKAFAATNPKIAAANAERARIRGTAQTDNPLMKDMRSRMPSGAPTVQSPAVAKLGAGNQSLANNPNAGRSPAPAARPATPAPRPAATSFNPNAPRVVPTASRPSAGGAAAVARPAPAARPATPAPRPAATSFNPNAPRVVPTASRPSAGGAAAVARPAPAAKSVPPTDPNKKKQLQQSADLFDIVKGELLDEGYSEEDAMYIMANLNEEQREIVMNEGIGALLKLGAKALKSGAGKKVLSKAANLIKGGKKGKSAISKRATKVVKDQRAGVAGTDDALNVAQKDLEKSMSRLRRQERRGGQAAASLNAKAVERDVRRAAAYGPQTSSSKPFAQRIDPPKPTGGKIGFEVPKQSSIGRPLSYKEMMAQRRKEWAGKSEAEKKEIFNQYIKRWEGRNK